MKHCILAKWNETVTDKAALLAQVRALYTAADDIPGVHSVMVHPCCIDRPNRYNLMIVLDMDREALPNWDASDIHHRWKDEFGPLLEQKAIFDFE
mgnify:CR=1 FL=1